MTSAGQEAIEIAPLVSDRG